MTHCTISTHNGTQIARQHNLRNPRVTDKEGHIRQGADHETWIDESPQEAYHRLFDDALAAYNAKQKRNDRRIENYYRHIEQDARKNTAYEMIIGVYADDIPAEEKKAMYREYLDGWKERNPNLELIGAYWHNDEEGGAHLHIDYIPVVRGCSRGLETQTALVRALEQQDPEGTRNTTARDTAQIRWERKENAALEQLCKERGYEVDHPEAGNKEVQHLETEVYKLTQELEKEKALVAELTAAPPVVIQAKTEKIPLSHKTVLTVNPDELKKANSQIDALKKDNDYYKTENRSLMRKCDELIAEKEGIEKERDEIAAAVIADSLRTNSHIAIDMIKTHPMFDKWKKRATNLLESLRTDLRHSWEYVTQTRTPQRGRRPWEVDRE